MKPCTFTDISIFPSKKKKEHLQDFGNNYSWKPCKCVQKTLACLSFQLWASLSFEYSSWQCVLNDVSCYQNV